MPQKPPSVRKLSSTSVSSHTVKHIGVAPPPPIPPAPKCPVAHAFPVLISCFVMAANAGFLNAFFMESIFGTSVSHLTGTTTRAAAEFATGDYDMMFRNIGIVFFFFVGSCLNSLIVGDSQMRLVQNYGFAIMLEAGLLLAPVFIPTQTVFQLNLSIYIVACACGLQNAMLTIYGTAVVRTTHVTGLVTDVGILCGLYIRDLIVHRRVRNEGMWKIKIMVPLYLGFFTGGTLGMLAVRQIPGTLSLLIPSIATAWIGVGFIVLRYVHNKNERVKRLLEEEERRREREGSESMLHLPATKEEGEEEERNLLRRQPTEEIEMQRPEELAEEREREKAKEKEKEKAVFEVNGNGYGLQYDDESDEDDEDGLRRLRSV